ncbi:MAG: outer membrane protein [Xanthobacteraceae bacterium]
MKKILLASASLVVLVSSASAADLQPRTYTKAPPPPIPAPIYTWTGFYIGGHLGGAFDGNSALGSSNGRLLGGVQAGFDYQFATNWVLGIEGQYSFADRGTNSAAFPGGFTVSDRDGNLGSVTGRLGYTWGPALLYAKGGVGFREGQNVNVTDSVLGVPVGFTANTHDTGYTVGAGLEYMFARNWSAKIEYQYYNFGRTDVFVPAAPAGGAALASYRPDEHTVKVGLNYRFNLGGL